MNTKTKLVTLLASLLVSPAASALETLSFDINDCDPALAPFVVAISVGNFEKKPPVDALKVTLFDDEGKKSESKPSAEQRDQAWDYYQLKVTNADDSEQETKPEKEEKKAIKFMRSHKNYIKNDITSRPKSVADKLIKQNIAVAYTPE